MSITEKLTIFFGLALVAFAVLGLLLYRTMSAKRRIEFQIALLIQLLGTVAFGAVVTYSLYTIQHSQDAQEKQQLDAQVAAENKKRVLGFIRDELSYDLLALNNRDGIFDASKQQFKSEFWKIAGLSGDLKWVDDAQLLNTISQAYFDIGISAAWESRLTDAAFGPGSAITLTFSDGKRVQLAEFLSPFTMNSYKTAKASVSAAIDKLKSN